MTTEQRILVTGGAGFIGSCYIRNLLEQPQIRVLNVDKLTYAGCLDSIPSPPSDRYRFVQGDVADRAMVERCLGDFNPTSIVHFAAETHVDRSIDAPSDFIRTNVTGTFELLDTSYHWWCRQSTAFRDSFRFVHISTDEVFGSLGPTGLFKESSPIRPNSPYSASKAAADQFVRAYFQTYRLPVLTVHCSNNYGPYQSPEKLIPRAILRILDGRSIPLYGNGENIRDWLFVEDTCRGVEAIRMQGRIGESYNLGGNFEKTNLEVAREIAQTVSREVAASVSGGESPLQIATDGCIEFVEDRPGHDFRYALDTTKLRQELGWQPRVDFARGLLRTIQWYRQNPEWLRSAYARSDLKTRRGHLRPVEG